MSRSAPISAPLPRRADGLPTVSVVIPARNEQRLIAACLSALLAQPAPPDEIVVVDNGSADATAGAAAGFGGVRVVTEARPGVTYARRTGFDAARGEVIARIDADCEVAPNWARTLRLAFAGTEVDGIGGTAAVAEISPAGRFWGGWWYRAFRRWHERSLGVAPMLYGFNSAFRSEAWRRARPLVGVGDEAVSDDVDVTLALLRTGHVLRFEPRLRVRAGLFRSCDRGKLAGYYRSDGLTLARHGVGNPARWILPEEMRAEGAARRRTAPTAPRGSGTEETDAGEPLAGALGAG